MECTQRKTTHKMNIVQFLKQCSLILTRWIIRGRLLLRVTSRRWLSASRSSRELVGASRWSRVRFPRSSVGTWRPIARLLRKKLLFLLFGIGSVRGSAPHAVTGGRMRWGWRLPRVRRSPSRRSWSITVRHGARNPMFPVRLTVWIVALFALIW